MWSIKVIMLSCILLIAPLHNRVSAQTPSATVAGTILNQQNLPIPGLAVYLVHPVVGRSYPSYTDNYGRCIFYNVPLRQDPYYLEIYWGKQLLYRNTVIVAVPNVVLPVIKL
jgi:hypothetical protein